LILHISAGVFVLAAHRDAEPTTPLLDKDPEACFHFSLHLSHDHCLPRSRCRRWIRCITTLKFLCCLLGILTLAYALVAFFLPERTALSFGLLRSNSSQQVGLGEPCLNPPFAPKLNISWNLWKEVAELLQEAEIFEETDV
jgi:hypothetical protein